jgi:hypothetical protein
MCPSDSIRVLVITSVFNQDMRLMGELKYGKYADIFPEEPHPEVLENYGQSSMTLPEYKNHLLIWK